MEKVGKEEKSILIEIKAILGKLQGIHEASMELRMNLRNMEKELYETECKRDRNIETQYQLYQELPLVDVSRRQEIREKLEKEESEMATLDTKCEWLRKRHKLFKKYLWILDRNPPEGAEIEDIVHIS